MKQVPGALYIGSGKEGATKIELDGAKAALSVLEADDLVVQAKAPTGANGSTTGGCAARVLDVKIPPAPYYHDADGIGAREAGWYAPGDELSGRVSRPGQLPGGVQRRPDGHGRRRDRGRPRGARG